MYQISATMVDRLRIPNPCLVGILLIMCDASEPNFVFHYPPAPRNIFTTNTSSYRVGESTTDDTSSESSLSSNSDDEEDGARSPSTIRNLQTAMDQQLSEYDSKTRSHGPRSSMRRHGSDHEYEEEDEEDDASPDLGPSWNHVLGFQTDFLAKLLSPAQCLCGTKFELAVDNLVFLGYPVHERSDGSWLKRKRKSRPKKTADTEKPVLEGKDDDDYNEGNEADDEEGDSPGLGADNDAAEVQAMENPAPEQPKEFSNGNAAKFPKMSMFHVVFIMSPPQLEYHSRIDDMYENVVKHFTGALKEEEANDRYVTRECNHILDMKEKARNDGMKQQELWDMILQESNLAEAICQVYNYISTSRIARVVLNKSLEFSLKIPITTEIDTLPSNVEPQMPGVYLTTAHSFGDDIRDGDSLMVPHFALLWLEDPEDIIKEVTIDDTISATLIQFIRYAKPTLTFIQIAQASNMKYQDVEMLARYLVYWRKARPIPPLHHRNYYTVSPNADMKKLSSQISIYNRLFPTLPSLPKMLANLSLNTRQYKSFIPTVDHRTAYIDILAWLMRHGWVIQVRTFGFLRIPPDIKRICAENKERLEADNIEVEEKINVSSVESNEGLAEELKQQQDEFPVKLASTVFLQPPPEKTGLRDVYNNPAVIINDKVDEKEYEESILLNPNQLTPEESAWLEQLTKDHPPDIVALFTRIVRYLDGTQAIEKIALREGISKAEVKRVIKALGRYLIFTRHW